MREKRLKTIFIFIFASIVIILSFGASRSAFGWKEQMHKDQLSSLALRLIQEGDKDKLYQEIWLAFKEYLLQGAWDEDFPCSTGITYEPGFLSILQIQPLIRANNHYRHALSGIGLSGGPWFSSGDRDVDTITWAESNAEFSEKEEFAGGKEWKFLQWGWTPKDVGYGHMSWEEAIQRYGYTESSKKLAYYTLGFLLHLLQDMGCPEHVHDDCHAASGYTGFEWWVYDNWDKKDTLMPDITRLNPRQFKSMRDYFINLSLLGYSIDRFNGGQLLGHSPYTDPAETDLGGMFKISFNPALAIWTLDNYDKTRIMSRGDLETSSSNILNPIFKWDEIGYGRNPLWTKAHDEGEWWPTSVEMPRNNMGIENDIPGYYYLELSGETPGVTRLAADPIRNLYPRAFLPTPLPRIADQCQGWRENRVNGQHLYSLIGKKIFPHIVEHTAGLIELYYQIVSLPPFVQSVYVNQGSECKYSGVWEDVEDLSWTTETIKDVVQRNLIKEPDSSRPGDPRSSVAPGDIYFIISFSKPVRDVAVRLGHVMIHGELDRSDRLWRGACRIEEDGPAEEVRVISIKATDKDEHYGGDGGLLDRDPRTPARRKITGSEYVWFQYQSGEDDNHSIRIKRIRKEDEQLKVMSDIDLISGAWAFGRVLEGRKKFFLCRLVLTKTRGEHGYEIRGCHPNESYWELIGRDTILFRHKDGSITSRLTRRGDGYWEGPYIPHKSAPVAPGETAKPHYIER